MYVLAEYEISRQHREEIQPEAAVAIVVDEGWQSRKQRR